MNPNTLYYPDQNWGKVLPFPLRRQTANAALDAHDNGEDANNGSGIKSEDVTSAQFPQLNQVKPGGTLTHEQIAYIRRTQGYDAAKRAIEASSADVDPNISYLNKLEANPAADAGDSSDDDDNSNDNDIDLAAVGLGGASAAAAAADHKHKHRHRHRKAKPRAEDEKKKKKKKKAKNANDKANEDRDTQGREASEENANKKIRARSKDVASDAEDALETERLGVIGKGSLGLVRAGTYTARVAGATAKNFVGLELAVIGVSAVAAGGFVFAAELYEGKPLDVAFEKAAPYPGMAAKGIYFMLVPQKDREEGLKDGQKGLEDLRQGKLEAVPEFVKAALKLTGIEAAVKSTAELVKEVGLWVYHHPQQDFALLAFVGKEAVHGIEWLTGEGLKGMTKGADKFLAHADRLSAKSVENAFGHAVEVGGDMCDIILSAVAEGVNGGGLAGALKKAKDRSDRYGLTGSALKAAKGHQSDVQQLTRLGINTFNSVEDFFKMPDHPVSRPANSNEQKLTA